MLLIFNSCSDDKSNPVNSEIDFNYFYKSWTNSYEEQTLNEPTKIFRPSDYQGFPAAWYRETLIFNQDNTCSYLILDSNDAHYFQDGKWNLADQGKIIITMLDSTNTIYKKFQVTELKQDILKFIIVD
jgi:hypothetical protein